MRKGKIHLIAFLIIVVVFGMIFYQKITAEMAERAARKQMMAPAVVEMGDVVKKEIYDKSESVGRIQAKYSVDVVARINGWLEKRYFKEGAFVKAGQVLFQIERECQEFRSRILNLNNLFRIF